MKKHRDAERLQVIAPQKERHGDQLVELTAKVFSPWGGGYYSTRGDVSYHFFEQAFDWKVSRIGLLDGRVVTNWGVVANTMRVGGARLRVGGVTCVATDGEYRKRGLMPPTGRASIEAMRAAGYDVTMLFGIDDYYDRYGYVNAWAETDYQLKAGDLPAPGRAVRLHPFSAARLDGLTKVYNRAYARCTGTTVRSRFPDSHGRAKWERQFWLDADRRPAGYVVTEVREGRLTCHEQAGEPDTVLRVISRLASEAHCHKVRFLTLHGAQPLAALLRRMNCRVEHNYRRSGGPMIRTLNLCTTLEKLGQELARRLRRSPLAGWRGTLLVADARERLGLRISRAGVTVTPPSRTKHAIRGGEAIARLLLGSDNPDDVVDGGRIRTTGDARMLARVLFPNQHPELCHLDRY